MIPVAASDVYADTNHITVLLSRLDKWLDSMRSPGGYTGPVAHWWQNCLQFTGVGLDWRYEGIISAYLALFHNTGEQHWMLKAIRAGDDLITGQLSSGNYRCSRFELNPYSGGTPHEAACDLALLLLARTLKEHDKPEWGIYFQAAAHNVNEFYIRVLWDDAAASFRDQLNTSSFVPNKSATLSEALFMLSTLSDDDIYAEKYALPSLDTICDHQIQAGALKGAIYQNSMNGEKIPRFFPYYVARCIPGLLAGYEWSGSERYLNAAWLAMDWVQQQRDSDGAYPQVIYPGGRANRFPRWVAAVGDILRAERLLAAYGHASDSQQTLCWLIDGAQPSGGFRTAQGFAAQISQRASPLPEFRDLLPVCGWIDKTFRYLAESLPQNAPITTLNAWPGDFQGECLLHGKRMRYLETESLIELRQDKRTVYRWEKGASWAAICTAELLWK